MELPRLEPLWQKYRDQGLQIIAIDSERDTERAREFIAENELTYHLLEDVDGDDTVVGSRLQVTSFPSSFLVDRQGRVVYSHVGFDEGDEMILEEEIQKLLES